MDIIIQDIFNPSLFGLHLGLAFVFGTLWGSFFGLCIARIPAGQSIVLPNSYCFACGETIRWHDNIPLFSYWALKGRCRHCGTVFGIRHFFIELISGILFALVFWAHGYTLLVLAYWIFAGLLLVATFTDLDHWIIPDRISLGGAAIGVILAAIPFFPHDMRNIVFAAGPFPLGADAWWTPAANALVGAAFGYGVMWLIGRLGTWMFRKEAMGGGDMKLVACIGAFLGFTNCIYVLFLASVLGVLFGVSLLIADRIMRATRPDTAGLGEEFAADRLAAQAIDALYPEVDSNNPQFLATERNVLLQILTQQGPARSLRHHLPFGPYLAVAAFLVMIFHRQIQQWVEVYFNLFQGV